jgi:hypothetical protein
MKRKKSQYANSSSSPASFFFLAKYLHIYRSWLGQVRLVHLVLCPLYIWLEVINECKMLNYFHALEILISAGTNFGTYFVLLVA